MKTLVSRMDIHQEKMEAANHSLREWAKETMACQGTMEARLECKQPNSEDMETGAKYREVPEEHAAVRPVGGQRKGTGAGM
jgi:hypothetical protein